MRKLPLLSVLVGALVLAGCSDDLMIPDFNNPSLEELQDNPTRVLVNTSAQGLLVGTRRQIGARNGYTSLLGILGRESYNFDSADPRFITEMLDGALDPGSPAFGANLWTLRYRNIRNANILLNSLAGVEGFSGAGRAATGFGTNVFAPPIRTVIAGFSDEGALAAAAAYSASHEPSSTFLPIDARRARTTARSKIPDRLPPDASRDME